MIAWLVDGADARTWANARDVATMPSPARTCRLPIMSMLFCPKNWQCKRDQTLFLAAFAARLIGLVEIVARVGDGDVSAWRDVERQRGGQIGHPVGIGDIIGVAVQRGIADRIMGAPEAFEARIGVDHVDHLLVATL